MSNKFPELIPANSQEIERPLPLVTELFDFAANNGSPHFSDYLERSAKEIRLPEKLNSLTAGFPGVQFLVGYEDRTTKYYSENTRGKWAFLSNRTSRSESNEVVTELTYSQRDIKNYLTTFLEIAQHVNAKGFSE